MVIAVNNNTNQCHLLGKLTSQKSPTGFLSETQFKDYLENNAFIISKKKQYFHSLPNIEEIPKEKLIFIEGGSEYLTNSNINLTLLQEKQEELAKKPVVIFTKQEGYSEENALKGILLFYQDIINKNPIKKSKAQMDKDEANKLKQKEASANNKQDKENSNKNNDETT